VYSSIHVHKIILKHYFSATKMPSEESALEKANEELQRLEIDLNKHDTASKASEGCAE